MDIKYRIIEIHEKDHSFVVRYYTDLITEDFLASVFNDDGSIKRTSDGIPVRCRSDVSLTLFEPELTHDEVEKFIKMSAPVAWLKALEQGMKGASTSINIVKDKLNTEHAFTHEPPPVPTIVPNKALSDDELTALIAKLSIQ